MTADRHRHGATRTKPRPQSPLRTLATELGVQLSYRDTDHRTVAAEDDTLLAIIRALGWDVAGEADVGATLTAHRAELEHRLVDHVHVAWDGDAVPIALGPRVRGRVSCTLLLDGGGERRFAVDADGAPVLLPDDLPHGYHELVVEHARERRSSLVIRAPRHAYAGRRERTWGVFAPLYSVRSQRDWGIGDLGDARSLLELVDSHGGTLYGSTPLHATFLDEPFEPSPYSPVSRLFWNESYLEIDRLPEIERSAAARALLADPAIVARRAQLHGSSLVDHRAAYILKREVLEACAQTLFAGDGGPRRAAFEAWRAEHSSVDAYARYRAAIEVRGLAGAGLDATLVGDAHLDEASRYHEYVQWSMESQLAEISAHTGAGLYLDLPLGAHPDGFDVRHQPELFAPRTSIGAPPDQLAPGGQDWGLPPLHPQRARATMHRHAIACMQHLCRHATAVRIDHVMGLHRLFWIPAKLGAAHGAYVSYPAEELWAIVCLESHRSRTLVVGEDLGTVPDEVRRAMTRHDVRRSYVMQFELQPDRGPAIRPAPSGSLATLDTHDTRTWATFWADMEPWERGAIHAELAANGVLSESAAQEAPRTSARRAAPDPGADPDTAAAVATAAIALLGRGEASAVVATLEDAWGETEPQNVPGTTGDEAPNWRRRMARTVEQMRTDPNVDALLRALGEARTREAPDMASDAPTVLHQPTLLTPDDAHLFAEGTHTRMYERLGAHPMVHEGVAGTYFAVWAPNAETVAVMGDWNGWDRVTAPLRPHASTGIWEGFVPGIGVGEVYKFHIRSRWGGYSVDKADPFARRAEEPPRTGSVVWQDDYAWRDDAWMRERGRRAALDAPVSVYEVHLGSWMRSVEDGGRSLTYREAAPRLVEHVTRMGFTHVEFLPLMEHPFYGSWGYQTTGFFAPTTRFGSPAELKYLVDELHRAGIGVIVDWVPSHFPTDEHGLGYFDGTHLFEHADPRQGFHPDWKSFIPNLSRNEVRSFLLSSAMFWLDEFHIDGLRVDAVASMLYLDYSREEGEWIPNEHGGRENLAAVSFLQQLNTSVYARFPDVQTIAEESTAWPGVSRPVDAGGLGFGMKWDMGWMHDTLEYFGREAVHRSHHQGELTFRGVYAFSEHFMLPLSHDEVVHGKGSLLTRMPGDTWQQFANLRLLLAYMWATPGKKLLFMGGEFGQVREWNHDDSLDWHLLEHESHAGLARLVADLNRAYREHPALHRLDTDPAGFSWVDASDARSSVLSFLRHGNDDDPPVLAVLNATPVVRTDYRVGVPIQGHWRELLNSDAEAYWGGGQGNAGGRDADPVPTHGHPWSLSLTLPPLGLVLLTPGPG